MTFQDTHAELLLTGDEIRLTLQDAIALAIDNNLDVESVRLLNPMSRADIARARSGQLLRNLPSAVDGGLGSAAGPLATATPFGFEGSAAAPPGILSGLNVQLAGSPIPNTEPVLFATGQLEHATLPQTNQTVTGTDALTTQTQGLTVGVRKGFFTGTTLTTQFETLRTSRNAPFDAINPALTGNWSIRADQHLLQGFGLKTNMRALHIARNNAKVAELTFRQQVTLTVSQVMNLYYDLASFEDQVKVLQGTIERRTKWLDDNRKRLDLGLVSESEVIAMQIDLDETQQKMLDAQAQVAEQEATLKSVLTHAGLEDPKLMHAHIVPLDRFIAGRVSASSLADEKPEAIADRAIAQRPEIKSGEIGLANKQLSLLGTRSALKPTFDVYVSLQNNALAGQLNRNASAAIAAQTTPGFIGGFGTLLDQMGRAAYPDYAVGFQLNLPIVNRAAQSDMARDQIDLRQMQISLQTLRNGVRLQAIKSALALRQARQQYELSLKTRKLLEQGLSQEQKMFDFGTSDPDHLEAAQARLDLSRVVEITSLNTYARAQVNLEAVLNQTLEDNNIVIDKLGTEK